MQIVRFIIYFDFFLTSDFFILLYSKDIDIDNLTGSISANKKPVALEYIYYMLASPERYPSVTSELKMSVQPPEPASLIGRLVNTDETFMFSAHKIFAT